MESDAPRLSVVVPMFEEQDNVTPLYQRLVEALTPLESWEVVFVDDGSTDQTLQRLIAITEQDSRIRVVEFRRNYGQTPAMAAGIQTARGEIVITMDGDLQNDPLDIPEFVLQIENGYDIVVGWRRNRQDKFLTRKLPSKIANWLIGKVTGVPIRDNGCSLKAYRASVIKHIPLYSEMHRFIPAMTSLAGSRILEIPVRHHARIHGNSKYGLKRIYKVALDIMVIRTLLSSSGSPISIFAKLSALGFVLGTGLFLTALWNAFQSEAGLVLIGSSVMWFILGSFSLFCGILAELVYRTNSDKESYLARLTTKVS